MLSCFTDRTQLWWAASVGAVAALVLAGCPPQKPSDVAAEEMEIDIDDTEQRADAEVVVARIGGEEITREEFNRRIDGLVEFARARLQSEERREDFLSRIAEFEIMADEAERQNLGNHSRTRHAIKEAMADLMVEEHVGQQVAIADITDEERRAHFDEHYEDYYEPERRRIGRLVVDDERRADELRERFVDGLGEDEDLDDQINEFRRLAFRHSGERTTGDDGGDAGWWDTEDGPRHGEDVFEWEHGTVRGPFEEDGRWVLEMIIEVDEAFEPQFEDVEQQVTNAIYEQRRRRAKEEFVDQLRGDADIEIFEDRLEGIEAPPAEVPPPLEELPRIEPQSE